VANPITVATNTVPWNPFPLKNETEPIASSPGEESSKTRVPVLRLIPRPSSSNSKQGKMKLSTIGRTQFDHNSSELATSTVFSTPTKTMIGDQRSIDNPSPIPSLLSTPLSMSPHSFLHTPSSFGTELGVQFRNEDSSLQKGEYYFTPLEFHDEWKHPRENKNSDFEVIHDDLFDYMVPDLIDQIHHDDCHDPSMCETPSRLHFKQFNQLDTNLHVAHRTSAVNAYGVKVVDDVTADIICCVPIVLNKTSLKDRDNCSNLPFPPLLSPPKVKALSINSNGSNSSSSPPLSCTVAPQNLKGDPQRQAKVKTELCIHYLNGTACPFGDKCNYAHGEEELKYTRLYELQKAGLISDVNKYRTHPCLSWVSTGAWYVKIHVTKLFANALNILNFSRKCLIFIRKSLWSEMCEYS